MIVNEYDAYTREEEVGKGQALWRAELSDGRVIVQDDHRPGLPHHSAWVRLRTYVAETGLSIRNLWLQFRSNVKRDILPANADAYFFCRSALGVLNSAQTRHFYLLGALTDGELRVQRWSVPDLTLVETKLRDPSSAGDCLIWHRPTGQQSS